MGNCEFDSVVKVVVFQVNCTSCLVAPGFDFQDFELAERSQLMTEYPYLNSLIKVFTH